MIKKTILRVQLEDVSMLQHSINMETFRLILSVPITTAVKHYDNMLMGRVLSSRIVPMNLSSSRRWKIQMVETIIQETSLDSLEQSNKLRSMQFSLESEEDHDSIRWWQNNKNSFWSFYFESSLSTFSACPVAFTFLHSRRIVPSESRRNVERITPNIFFPYIFFSPITPNVSWRAPSVSEMSLIPRLHELVNFSWLASESLDTPMISIPSFANSHLSLVKSWASRVQPGVLSFG